MNICPKCKTENSDDAVRCTHCNKKLKRTVKEEYREIKEVFLYQARNFMEASMVESILTEYNIPFRDSGKFNGVAGLQTFISPTTSIDIFVPEEFFSFALEAIEKVDDEEVTFTDEDIDTANDYGENENEP